MEKPTELGRIFFKLNANGKLICNRLRVDNAVAILALAHSLRPQLNNDNSANHMSIIRLPCVCSPWRISALQSQQANPFPRGA